jgi:hypothetical protein
MSDKGGGRPRAPLTDRDMETLGALIYCDDARKARGWNTDHGSAPIDFGGSNGSHHGATATKLVGRGLAEHKKRGLPWGEIKGRWQWERGSKVYRATEAGRAAYAAWTEAKKS